MSEAGARVTCVPNYFNHKIQTICPTRGWRPTSSALHLHRFVIPRQVEQVPQVFRAGLIGCGIEVAASFIPFEEHLLSFEESALFVAPFPGEDPAFVFFDHLYYLLEGEFRRCRNPRIEKLVYGIMGNPI